MMPPDMKTIRRVLIVKLSAIGDLVHALPVSAALGDAFPHLELTWIVEPMSAPMVTGNPYLKEVIVLPAEWRINRFSPQAFRRFRALSRDLRARGFDMALDLQGLSKSALVAWASGAKYRYGYDWLQEIAPLLERRVPRRPESLLAVEQYLDVARFLGAPVNEVKFPLHIPEEADAASREMLRAAGVDPEAPFAVVNPSAGGWGHKGWPPDRTSALVEALGRREGLPVVLVGSNADLELTHVILRSAEPAPASLVGRTDLKQLAAVIRLAAVHVSGDTGSAHVAAALGVPTICFFGRSDPRKFAPYGWERFAISHRECCAEPCRRFHDSTPINRKQKCFAPPPRCLNAVTVEEVLSAVHGALEERKAKP